MKRVGVFAADESLQNEQVLAQLSVGYDLVPHPNWRSYDPTALLNAMRDVDVIITGRSSPRLPDELAQNFGRLKWLCHCHGTVRHLVSKQLIAAGLIVTNWGDAVDGVAEGAMALLLCMLKQLPALDAITKTGGPWLPGDTRIFQAFPCTLKNLDVGLYGFGPIGQHMARMLEPFGPKIAIYDPYAKNIPPHIRVCSSLRELFSTCQAISVHCGLNDATHHSINAELLALLPQGAIIVNTARGAIIDEHALAAAVSAGRVLAGIDVIEHEKDWSQSPLATLSGVVLTGHRVGSGKGFPPNAKPAPKLPDFVLHNLLAFNENKPLINVITADIYDLKT